MEKLLTVIIPCYNCEKTLRAAVASCYTQGFSVEEFEIVMVDDASTDGTRSIMTELAQQYSNVRTFHHSNNQGGGAARNTAVAHSQAKVIFCLDSDDLLPPQTLAKMLAFLLDKQCDGVCFNHLVRFRGSDINDIDYIETYTANNQPIAFSSVLQKDNARCPLTIVFMFTREAFNKTTGYPTHHGFDTQGFGWRFLSSGLTAYVCPGSSYLQRIHFTTSYYLREYEAGKVNHHVREILMEHLPLFTTEARTLIDSFDYSDFTRNIGSELLGLTQILIDGYEQKLGTLTYSNHPSIPYKAIRRNSLTGILLRLLSRIRHFLNNLSQEMKS